MAKLDDTQRRDVLGTLADENLAVVVSELLHAGQEQRQLIAATGLRQPEISRSLQHLRLLGVLSSEPGRGAQHELLFAEEIRRLIAAVDDVVAQINDRRVNAHAALTSGGPEAGGG
jgi:predicted transcriptional regulator